MLDEVMLVDAMKKIGYIRRKKNIYKSIISTSEISHYLYISYYGKSNEYLVADFGIRNEEAEAFALDMIRSYGGEIYQLAPNKIGDMCFMMFSVGRLLSWGVRSSLYVKPGSEGLVIDKVAFDVQNKVVPLIKDVKDDRAFVEILLVGAEPFFWVYTNGAIRASIVSYLSIKCGSTRSQVKNMLMPYGKNIRCHLSGDLGVEMFIDMVIEEASRVLKC